MLTNIFGDKPWFKSLTAWGLVVWVAGTAALAQMCDISLLSPETCATGHTWINGASGVLVTLGLRRAPSQPAAK